jgi:hypothetical protein
MRGESTVTVPLSYLLRRASIPRLLATSGPSDISGFVSSVVVDPIHGVFGAGLGSDVVVERLEVVQPFIADGDAAPAVVLPRFLAGVKATCLHADPGVPLRTSRFAVREVVGDSSLPLSRENGTHLLAIAPTRDGRTSAEVTPDNILRDSAITHACPHRVVSTRGCLAENGKTTETLPRNVDQPHVPNLAEGM